MKYSDSTDLLIEVVDEQLRGVQGVGKNPRTVRVTHKPTGISVVCGHERTQVKNLFVAKVMLQHGLAVIGIRLDLE